MAPWGIMYRQTGHIALAKYPTKDQAQRAITQTLKLYPFFYKEDYEPVDMAKLTNVL